MEPSSAKLGMDMLIASTHVHSLSTVLLTIPLMLSVMPDRSDEVLLSWYKRMYACPAAWESASVVLFPPIRL